MNDSLTVVLVHGALTDASVWHPVAGRLQAAGQTVAAPPLPLRGLHADAAELATFLGSVDGPVVLVGHSYAGSVISHPSVADPLVRAVVFVAAFQPDEGEATGELNDRFPGSGLTPENIAARPYPGGTEIALRPEAFREVYANDVEPGHAAVMAAGQRPIDPRALADRLPGRPVWRDVPSWALVATDDHSLPVAAQRFMAGRAGSHLVEVASSHAAPVAHPDAVTDLIMQAVKAAL